jgi:hypothetical protein
MSEQPAEIEVTEAEIAEALRCPEEYLEEGQPGITGDPELFRTWALGPAFMEYDGTDVHQEEEGADLIFFLRNLPDLRGEWQGIRVERHGWWRDHVIYRALDEEGNPTRMLRIIAAWRARRGEGGA